jgi:hypothetical protein
MKFRLFITPRRATRMPPKVERRDLVRFVRSTARYIVPAILTFAVFTLVALTVRRLLVGLSEASDLHAVAESIEPSYEIPA